MVGIFLGYEVDILVTVLVFDQGFQFMSLRKDKNLSVGRKNYEERFVANAGTTFVPVWLW